MDESIPIADPIMTKIQHGWAAFGDGWAVHGRTREEAIQAYYEAAVRHREIDQRPFWYERLPDERSEGTGGDG